MEKYVEKIDKQIENIEQKIDSLLEDIDISEITPVDRIELAIKFQSQLAKFLALRKSIESVVPENEGFAILAAFQRHLRGERVGEE